MTIRAPRWAVAGACATACCAAFAQAPKAAAPPTTTVRFATFNASLNRDAAGQLLSDLAQPGIVDPLQNWSGSVAGLSDVQKRVLQAHYVAETIQKIRPDVLLVNEFDFDLAGTPAASSTPMGLGYSSLAAKTFQDNFLSLGHGGGSTGRAAAGAISYAWRYTPNTNTGLASGFDLDNNGSIGGGNDAFGFGGFGGQFGFTIYSKHEIVGVRSFQSFKWKDMPDNLLTNDTAAGADNLASFYSADETANLRLSSKNHVDVTLRINGQEVHFLTAHPTPPVFDGSEDRNGKRNHDEIRFWRDYINGASYIYDDAGSFGGLAAGARFVIAGDYNADLCDGDSYKVACTAANMPGAGPNAIGQLLLDPLVNTILAPTSAGGAAAATDPSNNGAANASHLNDPGLDTADFNDAAPGNLRVDYVLPSANLEMSGAGVFWPTRDDTDFPLVGTFRNMNLYANFPTSDHKAVFADLQMPVPEPQTWALLLLGLGAVGATARRRCRALLCAAACAGAAAVQAAPLTYLGQQIVPTGTLFQGTTVGGLSGLDYDAASRSFVAISDDRSSFNPARFYGLQLDLAQFQRSATPGMAGVNFQSVTTIQQPDGTPFGTNQVDPEGIRFSGGGKFVWSNEGQRSAAGFQNPTVREMNADGSFVRSFVVPARYAPSGSAAGLAPGDAGIFNNLAFESLSFSRDRKTLWTATENALSQDGPPATLASASPSRLLSFDAGTGAPGAEYVLPVSPVALAPDPAGGFATNGLTDLLAVGDRQFIGIERSFAVGAVTPGTPVTGNTIRLYLIDARQATDVSGLDSIAGQSIVPAAKTLLLDLSTLKHDDGTTLALDNIEGLTFGPDIGGQRTLVLVSDNNFSGTQFTQFVALGITGAVPEPQSWVLFGAGVALLLVLRRPRGRRT